MKRKTSSFGKAFLSKKRFVEIAVVLCSVFLVAIPAIAAEHTAQEVSASEVTTASEDDFVLEIYGNANEDDTIDMRDLTYVKLIFFGKKTETELADAKYDGKINPLDFIQIKLIIVGKEKEITFVDAAKRTVTVKKPIERIVVLNTDFADAICVLGERNKVVGVSEGLLKHERYFPEFSKCSNAGGWYTPDIEAILMCNPDTVCVYGKWPKPELLEDKLPETINVIRLDFYRWATLEEEMMKLGYLLGKVENAKEYINWHRRYVDEVVERVSKIPEEDKPTFYIDAGGSTGERKVYKTEIPGGINIAADLEGEYPKVEVEWILEKNPDVIQGVSYKGGYETDDNSKMKAHYEEIIRLPGFKNISAVKNNRVHIISNSFTYGPDCTAAFVTRVKWLNPELFKDMDPQAIHQEYIDRFRGIDFNVYKQGVFVYPPFAS